ncbi:hypothetical protein QVD17_25511 [Tagetes erecta]|uniref:Pentatricopeptide repeat-containing protein n=1 Tax=Tagetes erecta TaxID=13708 RepID=A0AAD8KLA2_TARER|nr:hypothetical protein QVD17_25511 [Tagetes erecta]
MRASNLIPPKPIKKPQLYTKSRLGFSNSYSSNTPNQNNQQITTQITSILHHDDWKQRIKSVQNLHQQLNPNVIESILVQSLVQDQDFDVKRLHHFFNWSTSRIGDGTSQNLKSFLILAMCFCNSNQLFKASGVLDKMIEMGKPVLEVVDAVKGVGLSSLGFSQLVYGYKSKNMLDEAVFLVLSYNKDGVFINSKCLNALMSDLLKSNKMDLFWKVYERLGEVGFTFDVFTYSNVIKGYCRSGKMEEAKRVFSEMEEKNCSPNLVIYNLLLGGLCRCGLVNEALDYKKIMTEKGLIPDEYTYAIIIEGLCRAKRLSDAKLVLDDMNNAGLIPKFDTYGFLIDGFMREGKIEEALSAKDEMVAKNYEPQSTLWCINNLMKDLLKRDNMKHFWNVYEKMLVEKLRPDGFTYTNVIGGYVRAGKLDEAKKLFYEMRKKGYNPNLVTYNVLISGLCKMGLIDEAFELKRSMVKKGLRPDIYTYTNLIEGLCKVKKSQDAKLLLKSMSYAGLSPDNITYTALIDGFLKQGEVDEAFELKNEMVAKGIEINLVTFNCIIDGLCKLGECDKAIKVLEEMKEEARVLPDVFCYNSLVIGLCKARRMGEARGFFTEMVENGVKPNAFTYGALISVYNDIAEVKIANVYFNEMIGLGIVPDQVVKKETRMKHS